MAAAAFFKRQEVRLLAVCMTLLAIAAFWLLSSRPGHRIEGDFLAREQSRTLDAWLLEQANANPIAEQRARACLALGRIGGEAARAVLLERLADPAPSVRAASAFGLGLIEDAAFLGDRPPNQKAAQALIAALDDEERLVVARVVEALGLMRWREAAARITQTPAPLVITMAALIRMDADELRPWIASYLSSDDQDSRWAAVTALSYLATDCKEGLEAEFVRLARDRNEFVRAAASRALGLCDPAEAVREALERRLADKDAKVRIAAVGALERLGALSAASPALGLRGDRNPVVQEALRRALDSSLAEGDPTLPRPTSPPSDLAQQFSPRSLQEIARTEGRRLLLETTEGGLELSLDYEHAPLTAERIFRLATSGAFDNRPVSKAELGHYVQVAADPATPDLVSESNSQPFVRGSVGLAWRTRDENAPEIVIALAPLPLADGRYTNFGQLLSGDNLIDRLTSKSRVITLRPAP